MDEETITITKAEYDKLKEIEKKYKKLQEATSRGGKKIWENISAEERTRIARERGRAGAAKRWKNKNK